MRHIAGIAVIDIVGDTVLGPASEAMRRALVDAFESGNHNLVVNFSPAGRIDSAGIGELINAYSTITRKGGAVKLVMPPKGLVHKALKLTGLTQLFDIAPDEDSALNGFNAQTAAVNKAKIEQFLG